VLKQPPEAPVPVGEQIALLTVLNEGLLDAVEVERVAEAEAAMRALWRAEVPRLLEQVADEPWDEREKETIFDGGAAGAGGLAGEGAVAAGRGGAGRAGSRGRRGGFRNSGRVRGAARARHGG